MIETLQAILAIVLIDLALSGDNALVIGMAARGLPQRQRRRAIVLFGSGLVVRLLDRFPQGIWLGAFALVWTAAEMMVDEPALHIRDALPFSAEAVLAAVFLLVIVAAG